MITFAPVMARAFEPELEPDAPGPLASPPGGAAFTVVSTTRVVSCGVGGVSGTGVGTLVGTGTGTGTGTGFVVVVVGGVDDGAGGVVVLSGTTSVTLFDFKPFVGLSSSNSG